jgi:signal transduction histidine kinase
MKYKDFSDSLSEDQDERFAESLQASTKAKNLELILEIGNRINRSLILDDVLELVLKSAIDITNSERGFIVLKDSKGKLNYRLCLNSEGDKLPSSLFKISTTVVEEVYYTNQSKFIEGAQSDSANNPSKSILNLELQTILCSPLVTGNKKVGVIYVDSTRLQKVKVKEITDTFEILANQAAIAINNAQLYHNQKKAFKELQDVNRELKDAKELAEQSNKLKSEFLRQMSHEVRTPINIILGALELLKDEVETTVDGTVDDTFEMIGDASKRIMRTIEHIIEMSQLKAGDYEHIPVVINLEKDILMGLCNQYAEEAKLKNIDLTFSKLANGPNIYADKIMVEKIFTTLIENGIKYTRNGSLEVVTYNNELGQMCVDVRDTGIGISPEYLTKIFTPFSQEETGDTRRFEGNGLGLAIVKKYAELNNIEINVISQKGKGSTFTITFTNSSF